MNKPLYLTEDDARAVIRLLSDVAELDGDHRVKKRFVVSRLAGLVDSDVWVWLMTRKAADASSPVPYLLIDGGWRDDQQKALYLQWHSDPEWDRLVNRPLAALWSRHFTRVRQELVSDERFYASPFFEQWMVPAGLDQILGSGYPVGCDDHGEMTHSGLMFYRARGKPAFGDRERCILHLVACEVDWLHRADTNVPAAEHVANLPPRLYQVMLLLLAGDSKKQIAHKLDLSYHTVDEYTQHLHHRFGVQSRGELLAKFFNGDATATGSTPS